MLKINKYQLAEYRDALHQHGPSQYCIPEKITKYRLNQTTGQYVAQKQYHGRLECGNQLHHALYNIKNWQSMLGVKKDPHYTKQMSSHRIKQGHGPAGNYTAEHMVNDPGFYPKVGQTWRKRFHSLNTWADGSPVPKYQEPYWCTLHAIEKSTDWIREYFDWLNEEESLKTLLLPIVEQLDPSIIEFDDDAQKNVIQRQAIYDTV